MTDLEHILPLWMELEGSGAEYVLATIVSVEGSSYRKPGARMLLASDGRRAGTVSGGCLEASVAQKAWWYTQDGPVVRAYSTLEDDGEMPYGSGCGGVVWILLERRATAGPLLRALKAAFEARAPIAIATVVEGERIGQRAFASSALELRLEGEMELADLAESALERRSAVDGRVPDARGDARVWVDYRPARPGLWIFGAGDDAKPLLRLARTLGWFVAVADGRSHLATTTRFADADAVRVLPIAALPGAASQHFDVHAEDAAVVMTHSFEQDARVLAALLGQEATPAYVGVLGPQRRTRELLAEAARMLEMEPQERWMEDWLEQMYAPVGLDLGAETPATIALSILSEVQKTLACATALPLRQVRGGRGAVTAMRTV